MQVKCLYMPEATVGSLRTISQTFRDKDFEWSTSLNTFSNGRGIPIGVPGPRQASELYVLGGRGSIIEWLRVQGRTPPIYAEAPVKTLYMYLLRKERLLDKNLTTLLDHSAASRHSKHAFEIIAVGI